MTIKPIVVHYKADTVEVVLKDEDFDQLLTWKRLAAFLPFDYFREELHFLRLKYAEKHTGDLTIKRQHPKKQTTERP